MQACCVPFHCCLLCMSLEEEPKLEVDGSAVVMLCMRMLLLSACEPGLMGASDTATLPVVLFHFSCSLIPVSRVLSGFGM